MSDQHQTMPHHNRLVQLNAFEQEFILGLQIHLDTLIFHGSHQG